MVVKLDPEMFPDARVDGLRCCDRVWAWRDLDVWIDFDDWKWICPGCHGVVRHDEYRPPKDQP